MSLKNLGKIEKFYGNGRVYFANPAKVRAFKEYNFDIERLNGPQGPQYWIVDEIVVALGCGVSRKKALQLVIKHIERELSEKK
jgi:hypothetical protein